jgi:hypothetical protein
LVLIFVTALLVLVAPARMLALGKPVTRGWLRTHLLVLAMALLGPVTATADVRPPIYQPPVGRLTYEGGPIQRDPVVYLIFWGPRWFTDRTGIVPAEVDLFRQLHGTAYQRVLGEYGIRNDVRLAGVARDGRVPFRHPLSLGDVAREVIAVAHRRHWRNGPNVQWVLLPQAGTNLRSFTDGCGEHGYVASHQVLLIPPYQNPGYSDCVYDYSADNGNRPEDLVAATTSITSHEYAEATTDPNGLTGWNDWIAGAEVADLCAWYSGIPAGMAENVTYLWSDRARGCVL